MRFIDVTQGTAHPVEGIGYPVNVAPLAAENVAMVVWPDKGEPWIEREPFAGREDDPDLLAIAQALMDEATATHEAPPPAPTLDDAKAAKRREIEADRKAQERDGVTIDGIRYAGDPDNRQALREAIEYADAEQLLAFTSWKSSDGQFLADHPVDAVRAAYQAIGAQRSQLIAKEGEKVAAIDAAADVATLEGITW